MAYITLALKASDKLTANVLSGGPNGAFIAVRIGYDISLCLPGNDSDAVVNARQWAKALTEAADQIVERLEAETIAEVV